MGSPLVTQHARQVFGCRDAEHRLRGCTLSRLVDRRPRDGRGVERLPFDAERAGVELAGQQDVLDEAREPLRLLGDHAQQQLPRLGRKLVAARGERERRAVQRGEGSPELVRDGGHELGADRLQPVLARGVAERVDDAVAELHARDRQPELAAVELERDRGRPVDPLGLGGRDAGDERPPARERSLRADAAHLLRGQARDRLGGSVPDADHAARVDEEHAFAEVGQHPRGLVALLPREAAAPEQRREGVGRQRDYDEDAEADQEQPPARCVGAAENLGRGREHDEPRRRRRPAQRGRDGHEALTADR